MKGIQMEPNASVVIFFVGFGLFIAWMTVTLLRSNDDMFRGV